MPPHPPGDELKWTAAQHEEWAVVWAEWADAVDEVQTAITAHAEATSCNRADLEAAVKSAARERSRTSAA